MTSSAEPDSPAPAAAVEPGARDGHAALTPSLLAVAPSTGTRRLRRIGSLRTFDSLHNANFRWYLLSMLGVFGAMNTQILVMGYLVFQLTGSYAALGAIALANAVPGLGLSLAGGVIADRVPKRRVQQIGSSLNAANAAVIALLLFAGALRYEHLFASAVVQGVIQGLMLPSRQSMIPDIVLPRHVMNAVALNNALMNLGRMIMPAIGGLMLAFTHAYWVYVLMAACHLSAVATMFKVPARPIEVSPEEQLYSKATRAPATRRSGGGVGDLVDGMRYVLRDRTVGTLLLVNFLMVMFSMHWLQMLPGFVEQVLGGGPRMQGALISISSIGSVAASIMVASLPSRHRGRVLLGGAMLLGAALIAFSASSVIWITAPLMVLIGMGQSTRAAMSNVLVQSYADDRYRGRVMSLYMMELNIVHVGTFIVGIAAEVAGIQWALGATAGALLALSVGSYALSPRMRNLD